MKLFYILFILTILSINQAKSIQKLTNFNNIYNKKMLDLGKPIQESPWGFQEVSLENTIEHNISTITEYQNIIHLNVKGTQWKDNKVHIIHFSKGTYIIPKKHSYYIFLVPSRTIIEGAGIKKTIFKAVHEIAINDSFHFRKLFNLEYATHDVVVREISFYNTTKDNKWGLFHSNGKYHRENYLFENIEFDDCFGAIGKNKYTTNFITFRGLRKRIGNTTTRINKNFSTPIPINYQFHSLNSKNIHLASQIGVREGNSIVFHDCELGDNLSATIDIYSNYIEIVGITFINPLHDHSIKSPSGNHLYIHDSTFKLLYTMKLIEGNYWNPTFFTHEGGGLPNYHFKNLKFERLGKVFAKNKKGKQIEFIESEPFMLYDNRANNISGDIIWENIVFKGYNKKHQVLGYANVDTSKGYKAINYTNFRATSAQLKLGNNNSRGNFKVAIQKGNFSSKKDITGVYSWGNLINGKIDYPQENRLFKGLKFQSRNKPYVAMRVSTVKKIYNQKVQ